MDAALLLIAGNESCPQPQTSEHLAAIEIMKLKHILILQNKIDLVKEAAALEQHKQILAFVQGKTNDDKIIFAHIIMYRNYRPRCPHHPHFCPIEVQYRCNLRIHL